MVNVPLYVTFRMAWNSLGVLPCREKKLMTARVSMLLKSRASPDMRPFSLCNKKRFAIRHMNRHLFPMTLSIPPYDIANYVGLRTYQQSQVNRNSDTHINNLASLESNYQLLISINRLFTFWIRVTESLLTVLCCVIWRCILVDISTSFHQGVTYWKGCTLSHVGRQ